MPHDDTSQTLISEQIVTLAGQLRGQHSAAEQDQRGCDGDRCDILPATGALGATSTAWPWYWRARQRD